MSDFDEKCVYLELQHGKAAKMECLRPWSKPEYREAVTPFSLSATYKITYEDGAEVVIGGLPAYALAQGSFWYFSDSKKEPESVFARDDRVLAYLALVGQILRREKPGECDLPSQDEADCILNGLDVPFEALEYGSEWACKNMDRWVNEWKQRGLIKWDEENHIWRIVQKSLKEKWGCWEIKRTLKPGQRSLSVDGKEVAIVDANLGKVKRISVEQGVDVLLAPRDPITMETALIVEYENAKKYACFPPWETLALGWVRCHTDDGQPGLLCNKQVVAAIGRAIDNLEPFLEGEIAIPSEAEADEIIKKLDIPYPPISYGEAGKTRPFIKMEMMKKWKKSGKLCQMKDGSYEIEELPDSKNALEVRMALEHREKDEGRAARIAKSGKEVALEAIEATTSNNYLDGKSGGVQKNRTIAIAEEDWVDEEWGNIVSCEAVPLKDSWPWNKGTCVPNPNPWITECRFKVTYENGKKAYLVSRGWEILMGCGLRGRVFDGKDFKDPDGEPYEEFRFFNGRLMATAANALAKCVAIPPGEVAMLAEEKANKVLNEYDILSYPVLYSEEREIELFKKWKKRWLDEGICVDNSDGNGSCVSKALLEEENARSDDRIPIQTENYKNHFVAIVKKKRSKAKKKPTLLRWPKSKAEHRENQMRLWGGEEGLKGFETRELNTASGKKCTYRVRVDPSGRMWIADTGEDAPAGYYSQSSKYYVLTRNARPSKQRSTLMQRGMWYACLERFKSPSGFLVSLGNRGLIRKIDGKCAEMNFERSASGRRLFDSCEAYYPVAANEKKSRYILVIEQAKIKLGSAQACEPYYP